MPQIINTNIASLNAQRNLNKSQSANQTSLQRLSSGLRINSAKDDAAGLAISTRFNSQIRGLNVAVRNAGDGISLAQTAEGALGSMNDNLQRVRELAVQSANATNSDVDRDALQAEVSQLLAEVSRTAEETDFNGRKLLDGTFDATFQIGANAGQTLDISISALTADKLGASDAVGISSQGNSNALANGDLLINGTAIPPSKASDDSSSFADADTSAIAKSAAINSVYDETGVKAVANENTLTGAEMTAPGVATTGVMTLNGVNVSISQTTDAAQTRAGAVAAINAVSDQTGVTAVDSESDAGGVNLIAADGRNITVTFDASLSKAASGIDGTTSGTSTQQGGFTLVADGDVSEVVISGGDGTGNGDLKNAGLVSGAYSTTQAQLTSTSITKADGVDLSSSFGGSTGISLLGTQEVTTTTGNDFFGTGNTGEIITVTAAGQDITIGTAANSSTNVQILATSGFGADALADALNKIDGVEASAETKIQISAFASSTGTLTFHDAGSSSGTSLGAVAFTSSSTLATIATSINELTAGNLVAEYSTASGATLLTITDVTGNTILTRSTAAGTSISVATGTETGGFSGAAVYTAAGTQGIVSVGYIKETNVTDESITSIGVSSNLSGSTSGVVNTVTTGLISAVFATAGHTAGLGASGFNSITSTVTPSLTGLTDGDLTLNGVSIKAADALQDTATATKASDGTTNIQTSNKQGSAIAIAAAINDVSSETGVTAIANETVIVGSNSSTEALVTANAGQWAVGDSGKVYINGVDIGVIALSDDGTGGVDTKASRALTIDAINAKTGQSGVKAEDNGKSITLVAEDGRNISIAVDNDEANNAGTSIAGAAGFGAMLGLDSTIDGIGEADIGTGTSADTTGTRGSASEGATYETTYGTITLQSAKQIEVSVSNDGKDELAAMGLTGGKFGGGENGQFLTEIDVSTFEGATAALTAIDNAIGSIASQRADLGAIQNRMESTVSNLAITSENLSAANSRIQDADFAAETAELSRTQVLQQAGISILSQANQGPQQVLSLLG
jgi:flagellin